LGLRLQAQATGSCHTALVIGGAGRIGAWCARLLRSQLFTAQIAAPSPAPRDLAELPNTSDWTASSLDAAVIVVAAPLRRAVDVLRALIPRRPQG